MLACERQNGWMQFLEFMKKRCSPTEFQNWIAPIKFTKATNEEISLEVPNIFVKEYLLDNYKKELSSFFPLNEKGEIAISFVIAEPVKKPVEQNKNAPIPEKISSYNKQYTFDNFIEGPSNQFVKSAALGVAHHPGKSFNPLFIHGGVGLGKTHLLHGIGQYIKDTHKKLITQCITTEAFINDLVFNLRNKSVDKMKKFYRTLDVLLVDDIQFLQNRQNFEEEFCNTFEILINQNKQIVITSDKPPSQLNLSERMIARMEWGLVAHIDVPELETRVAIIQNKAQQKDAIIPNEVAFFIAEHIYSNVRQLEGAINRLCAYSKLMHSEIDIKTAEIFLKEMFQYKATGEITVEAILKGVASLFEVKISDLKSNTRLKNIAYARQVAMYLAKELMKDSLVTIASSFGGKTHSTLLHAWKKIAEKAKQDETLSRQIQMIKRNLNQG